MITSSSSRCNPTSRRHCVRRSTCPNHDSFTQSHTHILRDSTLHQLTTGARIVVTNRSSFPQAHLARALRITRVDHRLKTSLNTRPSVISATKLTRSLKRPPFKRGNRSILTKLDRSVNKFRNGTRDLQILAHLRFGIFKASHDLKLGLAQTALSSIVGCP